MFSDNFKHHHKVVIISAVTLKLQGFFDALAYSVTPQVLKKWQFFIYDNLLPTIEWVSYSNQSSSVIGAGGGISGVIFGNDKSTFTTSPLTKNISPNSSKYNSNSNSNSNSKGSSYFSYAQEESDCIP